MVGRGRRNLATRIGVTIIRGRPAWCHPVSNDFYSPHVVNSIFVFYFLLL